MTPEHARAAAIRQTLEFAFEPEPAKEHTTSEKRYGKSYTRTRYALRKTGMEIGSAVLHLRPEHIHWLASNKPSEMSISEYLIAGLLDDAMAPDDAE